MWDLIVSVPDHCLSFYLTLDHYAFFYCCLATTHVPNNQVSINSIVAFIKHWCIQTT